jgi:hypothetical protein
MGACTSKGFRSEACNDRKRMLAAVHKPPRSHPAARA